MPEKITIDLIDFAKQVERLCDFLLAQSHNDGSEDRRVIEDLYETAKDLQVSNTTLISRSLEGLSGFMKGAPIAPEKLER